MLRTAETIRTYFEGDPVPGGDIVRVLAVEDVPTGTGTTTRRRYTVLVREPGCFTGTYVISSEELAKR